MNSLPAPWLPAPDIVEVLDQKRAEHGDNANDDRSDTEAHCAIVAYFAFVNRIADGLGVELEQEPHG